MSISLAPRKKGDGEVKIIDQLREQRKDVVLEHKKTFTTFDILCPDAKQEDIDNFSILENDDDYCVWSLHSFANHPKEAYDMLRHNFEVEKGDLEHRGDFDGCALLSCRLLDPGLVVSKRMKYVGCVCFDDSSLISWAWIHPYFRRKGYLTALMENFYIPRFGVLRLQPPFTHEMHCFVDKLTNRLYEDEKLSDLLVSAFIRNCINLGAKKESLSKISKEDFFKILSAQSLFSAMLVGEDNVTEKIEKLTLILIEEWDSVKNHLMAIKLSDDDIKKTHAMQKTLFESVCRTGKNNFSSIVNEIYS